MPGPLARSVLHVEGSDDKHSLIHLLIRHGIDYDRKPWPIEYPEIQPQESVENVLEAIETAVAVGQERTVGFVLDADLEPENRWKAVCNRLKRADVPVGTLLPTGFIGESKKYRTRVGIWIMPNNQTQGRLEDFIQTLVESHDPVFSHAKSATASAKAVGARFREVDTSKAELHAWLAWQQDPGLPYGKAIRAKYFRHDSTLTNSFVSWFRQLFEIK